MMKKLEMKVLGISHGTIQNGTYQVILYNKETDKNLHMIIGAFEAQIIAIELENIKTPRPLIHDLLIKIINTKTDLSIKEVEINKVEEGIFYSNIIFDDGSKIDSRTSDAISIALKSNIPIYINKDIIDKLGIDPVSNIDEKEESNYKEEENNIEENDKSYNEMEKEKLEELLNQSIKNEDYEKASEIKKIIEEKNNE